MHRNYITLRALVVQLLLLVLLQTSLLVGAEEPSPSTTITTTSTTVVSTKWVVITSASGSLVTYTTSAFATGSTLGITTIAGSIVESTQASSQTPAPSGAKMAWEGQGFKDAVLNSTNQYRAQHEASSVKWNQTLASYAQDHADGCEFKHTVSFLPTNSENPKSCLMRFSGRFIRRKPSPRLCDPNSRHRRLGERRERLRLREAQVLERSRPLHAARLEEHDVRRLRSGRLRQQRLASGLRILATRQRD
jgi:hypothetical protein